jgi:hypothetical protein|tara:strand:- start:42 stop:182 length:141 start_codon:yes stop_codon:yes gene_type:complete
MSVAKDMLFEEMERIEREEYDEDGNAKEGAESIDTKIQELFREISE